MIAFLIAWALIGVVFFAGILAEGFLVDGMHWDLRNALQVIPGLVMVVVLWPAGLAWWQLTLNRRGYRRG